MFLVTAEAPAATHRALIAWMLAGGSLTTIVLIGLALKGFNEAFAAMCNLWFVAKVAAAPLTFPARLAWWVLKGKARFVSLVARGFLRLFKAKGVPEPLQNVPAVGHQEPPALSLPAS